MARNKKGVEIAEMIPDRCIGCQICVGECSVGAIQMSAEGTATIDPEACIGCGKCSQVCPVGSIRFERKRRLKTSPEAEGLAKVEFADSQGVAIFIEVVKNFGAPVSWELVGKGKELAEKRKGKVIGLLLGHQVEKIAQEAITYGCDEVHVIDHPLLKNYLSKIYGKALADLCALVKPEILLIGATPLGRDLSGIVATHLQTGLTADCTALNIDEEKGFLLMTRPTFGGNIMATIYCQHHRPQMSTVRPRVMRLALQDPGRKGEIHFQPWVPPEGQLSEIVDFIEEVPELGSVDVGRAPALVVAGKGACDPASMPLLQELADLVGGVVACSRPVVESGLMPYERQVGQTGKTVAPKLYIGIGVSGAVQHLVGMQGSEKIMAINSDPQAPIFRVADVGLVGNYLEVVPALIAGLKKRKNTSATEDTEATENYKNNQKQSLKNY
jgi:electron transfer flavoprotein alpha subunit